MLRISPAGRAEASESATSLRSSSHEEEPWPICLAAAYTERHRRAPFDRTKKRPGFVTPVVDHDSSSCCPSHSSQSHPVLNRVVLGGIIQRKRNSSRAKEPPLSINCAPKVLHPDNFLKPSQNPPIHSTPFQGKHPPCPSLRYPRSERQSSIECEPQPSAERGTLTCPLASPPHVPRGFSQLTPAKILPAANKSTHRNTQAHRSHTPNCNGALNYEPAEW